MAYKYGSQRNPTHNSCLAVPKMKFLGVSIKDYTNGRIPLTQRDINLAFGMLKKNYMKKVEFSDIKEELQRQLFLLKKAEMNIASKENSIGIVEYIQKKLNETNL